MRRSVVQVAAVLMNLIMIKCVDGVSADEEMATFRGVKFDTDVRGQFPECRKCSLGLPCSKMELEAKKIEPKTCWERREDLIEIHFFDDLPLLNGRLDARKGPPSLIGFGFPPIAFDRLAELVTAKFGKPAGTDQLKIWSSKGLSIVLYRYEPGSIHMDYGYLTVETQGHYDKRMREFEEHRKQEEKVL